MRGAGEGSRVERRSLPDIGRRLVMVVVVVVVRRRHSHGASSQMLQLGQPLGEGQRARFDLVHLLTVT